MMDKIGLMNVMNSSIITNLSNYTKVKINKVNVKRFYSKSAYPFAIFSNGVRDKKGQCKIFSFLVRSLAFAISVLFG